MLAKGDLSGRLTITGDPRTQNGQFITTAKTEFVSRYLPKQSLDPSYLVRGSCLSVWAYPLPVLPQKFFSMMQPGVLLHILL